MIHRLRSRLLSSMRSRQGHPSLAHAARPGDGDQSGATLEQLEHAREIGVLPDRRCQQLGQCGAPLRPDQTRRLEPLAHQDRQVLAHQLLELLRAPEAAVRRLVPLLDLPKQGLQRLVALEGGLLDVDTVAAVPAPVGTRPPVRRSTPPVRPSRSAASRCRRTRDSARGRPGTAPAAGAAVPRSRTSPLRAAAARSRDVPPLAPGRAPPASRRRTRAAAGQVCGSCPIVGTAGRGRDRTGTDGWDRVRPPPPRATPGGTSAPDLLRRIAAEELGDLLRGVGRASSPSTTRWGARAAPPCATRSDLLEQRGSVVRQAVAVEHRAHLGAIS